MNNNIAKIAPPLFLLWPLGGFLTALQNVRLKSSAIVIILFCIIFGYSFSFTDQTADSYRLGIIFSYFDSSSPKAIIQQYKDGNIADLYSLLLYGAIKIFSYNPKVLFAVSGLIFGVFMYLSILFFSKEKENKTDVFIVLLSIYFFALNPISNINGFRFWTAAWIFFYSSLQVILYNNKKWLLGLALTPFVHFSFFITFPVVIIFIVAKKKFLKISGLFNFLFIIYVITFLASWVLDTNAINLGFLSNQDFLNSTIKYKVDLYNGEELTDIMKGRSTSVFHTVNRIFSYALKAYLFVFVFYIWKLIKKDKSNTFINVLFAFVLLFSSFAFLSSVIPSGGRFQNLASQFTLLLILKVYVKYGYKKIQRYIFWGIPFFLFHIFFGIGYISYTVVSSSIWFSNLFSLIYEGIGFKI